MEGKRFIERATFMALFFAGCLSSLGALGVEGRVLSEVDGAAIGGATVRCGEYLSITLEDGSFGLECGEGLVELRVEAPGYLPVVQVLVGSTGLLVPLTPFETAGGEILVTASREPVTQALPARLDARELENAPSGGDPVFAALSVPSLTEFTTMSSDTGVESLASTRLARAAFSFNGSDPAWTQYAIDFIAVPRVHHFFGFPSADGVLPERTLAGIEVYAGRSPAFLGPGSSGLVRFMTLSPAELADSAHMGMGDLGMALSLGDDAAGLVVAAKKSSFELTIMPLMEESIGANYLGTSTYHQGGGTGSAIVRADLSGEDVFVEALLLGFYDHWSEGSHLKATGKVNAWWTTDAFLGLGARAGAKIGEASLGGFVYGTYSGVDSRQTAGQESEELGSHVQEGLSAKASAYASAPLGALELSAGATVAYDGDQTTLVNSPRWIKGETEGDPNWWLTYPDSPVIELFEVPASQARCSAVHEADPEARIGEASASIVTVYPWLAGSLRLLDALEASFLAGLVWHPDRSLSAPQGSVGLRYAPSEDFSLSSTLGAQTISPIPSEVDRQAILALTRSMAADEEGFQRSLSATLRADAALFEAACYSEARSVYYYELHGFSAQTSGAWAVSASDEVELDLREAQRAFSAASDTGLRWESGPFSIKGFYTLSSVQYELAESGWVRANSDIRHSLKASLAYAPPRGFVVGANLGVNIGRPFTPVSVVADASSPGGTRILQGAFNSGDDLLPRYSLDLKLAWRFPAFGGIGEIYMDTVNLAAFLNPRYNGLSVGLDRVVGSDTRNFGDRRYDYLSKFTLLGTVIGFRVRW